MARWAGAVRFLRAWLSPAGVIAAVLAVGAGALGYRVAHDRVAAAVYRDRVVALHADLQERTATYNAAVRKTAVTELRVADGAVSVVIRDAAGELQRIPTPFDPAGEIYLDYIVLDGRLWIRRVFDAATAPSDAVVIDPARVDVDWSADDANFGKAVYRSLSDGRWVAAVSGDGALTLRKAEHAPELVSAPEVRDFDPVAEVDAAVDAITWREVIGALRGMIW